MTVFMASGATVVTSVPAMVALVPWRCRMSPVMRWEKNSIGSRSTFHMYSALPSMDILPSVFSE